LTELTRQPAPLGGPAPRSAGLNRPLQPSLQRIGFESPDRRHHARLPGRRRHWPAGSAGQRSYAAFALGMALSRAAVAAGAPVWLLL
jgi:hypothetical protein